MEEILKDHLVDCSDDQGIRFSLTCMVCGGRWMSTVQTTDRRSAREAAAKEATLHERVCDICGKPVCNACMVDLDGILLCRRCADIVKKETGRLRRERRSCR